MTDSIWTSYGEGTFFEQFRIIDHWGKDICAFTRAYLDMILEGAKFEEKKIKCEFLRGGGKSLYFSEKIYLLRRQLPRALLRYTLGFSEFCFLSIWNSGHSYSGFGIQVSSIRDFGFGFLICNPFLGKISCLYQSQDIFQYSRL